MATILSPGANAAVAMGQIQVRVAAGREADIAAFRLYASGKTQHDADFVFYGQLANDDGSVTLQMRGPEAVFTVDLARIAADVQRIAFTATVDHGTIRDLGSLALTVEQSGDPLLRCEVGMAERQEAALILGELYRRNAEWKFRFVCQGFNGGLKPLAQHFGVVIAEPEPSPAPKPAAPPVPPPAAKVSLSKVSLSKERPTVSLEKPAAGFGRIRVNLNWARGKRGFFGGGGVDLDIGAYVRLKDGDRDLVQALGNKFGRFDTEPFVQLLADDRTGERTDGEWIHINGDRWSEIAEVMIFTFIYEGAPNWDTTDAVVTLHAPDQPPVETRLTEGNSRLGFCAIARLVNDGGRVQVERVNQFFPGHRECDRAFGWGFRWTAGSK